VAELLLRQNKIIMAVKNRNVLGRFCSNRLVWVGLSGNICFFVQGAKKLFGGKFWMKNNDCPYNGTDDNSPFQPFLGYEYKKGFCPRFSPIAGKWSMSILRKYRKRAIVCVKL
jgi:hypothetical protein